MAKNSDVSAQLTDKPFRSANTPGFAQLLEDLGISLLVTTYQAGKLMAVRSHGGRIKTLLRHFERPMGLAVKSPWEFALGTRNQIWFFRNAPDIAPKIQPAGRHDACFLPRHSHVTGDIRCHEMAWVGEELWIVNTFFSCLCTVHPSYCFVPRWNPPFLQASPGDYCHLNGLAVSDGKARFVTALGETSTPEGWRPGKAQGGIIIDLATDRIICRGLSMPHSPRVHETGLFVLDSGTGQFRTIDLKTGVSDVITELPGFTRGLAIFGPYAFIGLSKIREKSTFANLPIALKGELQCGIWVVDLRTGQTIEFMQFQAGVEEIFAIEVLADLCFPEVVGFQEDAINGIFLTPSTNPQGGEPPRGID